MKIAPLFIALLFLSCNKNNNWWGDGPEPDFGFFSFKEKETHIVVNDDVKAFSLRGYYVEMPDDSHAGIVYISLDELKTTAKPGIHFIHNPNISFKRSENNEYYCDITVIPENITEDVKIVYHAISPSDVYDNPESYSGAILETTILLRPDVEK